MQQGKFPEAKAVCQELLAVRPAHVESLMMLAEMAAGDKNLVLASQLYERAMDSNPGDAVPCYKLANVLKDLGQLETALDRYERAVLLDPKYAKAYCNRGVVLQRLDRLDEALASYERGISLDPADALMFFNKGTLLRDMRRPEEALTSFSNAIAVSPTYVAAFYNRGMLLQERREWEGALAEYDRAIEIDPLFVQCYVARGNLQRLRKQWQMALADFDRAIAVDYQCAAAHSNKAAVFTHLKQFDAAHAALDAAIALDPGHAEAHRNRGEALLHMKQLLAAAQSYDRAVELDPHDRTALLMRRHTKMVLCDWADLDADVHALAEQLGTGSAVVPPFPMLALVDSPRLHHKVAQDLASEGRAADHSLPAIPRRVAAGRIRVGYFSADFCEHPVALLSAQFLELHDRSKYEVIAFSSGLDTQDPVRKRLEKTFDQFFDVRERSDHDVALLARSSGLDIAIDLSGHTAGGRLEIFALRAAPVQIAFLGYPGTMGAEYIDYIVADATVIPEDCQQHYSEKILYLPDSFLPHDSGRAIASHRFTREQLGLPPQGVVFCCFNNSYKVLPDTFDSWMKILGRVDGSVLWLSHNNATAVQNLRREAQNRGVDPGRLVFAERMPAAADHLARLRVADLFLDTLPYNAHATALDALWSGLPILTRIGQGFAGRVAASLLTSVGLPELITSTAAQYEDLAVALAGDPPRLAQIRLKLEQNRLTAPLFDTDRFTRNLERAYARVVERYQAGLPPEHLYPD